MLPRRLVGLALVSRCGVSRLLSDRAPRVSAAASAAALLHARAHVHHSGALLCDSGRSQSGVGPQRHAQRQQPQAGDGAENSGPAPDGGEDTIEKLRLLQERIRSSSANTTADAKPRTATKTLFFETDSDEAPPTSSTAEVKGTTAARENSGNPFLKKLSTMNEYTHAAAFPSYDSASERRRQHIESKIREERGKMLVFRDVGMDLDKPILSRDVLLIPKYFRYGWEFALDNELERLLRYFNEHAIDELKITQDSKLMRGPPTLSKRRRAAPAPAAGVAAQSSTAQADSAQGNSMLFQLDSHFPSNLRAANLMQYTQTPYHPDAYNLLRQYLHQPTAASSGLAPFLLTASGGTHGAAPGVSGAGRAAAAGVGATMPAAAMSTEEIRSSVLGYTFRDDEDAQFTKFSPSWLRRPAVVIVTQMGQPFGARAELEWRRLCCECLYPNLLPHLPPPDAADKTLNNADGKHGKTAAGASATAGTMPPSAAAAGSASGSTHSAIDVIAFKSMDARINFGLVQRMYVRQYARFFENKSDAIVPDAHRQLPGINNVNTRNEASELYNLWMTSTSFVGLKLLQPFYPVLGVRNYLSPHVMLVDADGVVRWMSAGLPDAYESAYFPSLLKQLTTEYLQRRK